MNDKAKPYKSRAIGAHQLAPESLMMSYAYAPGLSEGSLKPPVFQTSTFVFHSAEEGKKFFEIAYGLREKEESEEIGLIYSRINNPNLEVLEDRLALWDHAEQSLAFASGMAAISTTLLSYLRPGDALIHSEPVYGGTEYLVHNILPQFGVACFAFNDEQGVAEMQRAGNDARAHIKKSGGRVGAIYVETPANPTNGLVDIAAARALSESLMEGGHRPPLMVDNTFLGPLWQTPLDHGADLTLMSLTKYVGGHSDLIAGSCSGSAAHIAPVRTMRTILGAMSDPHTAWMLLRSLETLKLRMEASVAGAEKVAAFLTNHEKVADVWYLGNLPQGHPDRAIYDRQCRSPGSTFSFEVKGGEGEAFRLLNALKLIKLAVSLGGTETLASHPAAMTHSDVPPDERARLGITESMIRISVGVERPEDLIADLAQALETV